VNEDESLRRYGLSPVVGDLDEVREILAVQAARERRHQGDGDTELMKLCCVQLFNAGFLTDAVLIWHAKESSWDAHCSIDVQLLCGVGLEETTAHLTADGSPAAAAALEYLRQCEASGDFADFSVENQSRWYSQYYTALPDIRFVTRTDSPEMDGNHTSSRHERALQGVGRLCIFMHFDLSVCVWVASGAASLGRAHCRRSGLGR
jgi:hypothetical protein